MLLEKLQVFHAELDHGAVVIAHPVRLQCVNQL